MLEELKSAIAWLKPFPEDIVITNDHVKAVDTLISFAQLILDSKGWPEKIPTEKLTGETKHWAEHGNAIIDLCLASYVREKVELIEKIPSVGEIIKELKNIGEYWTICKQDAGRELLVLPMGQEAIKIKAQAIHSELIKRLKDE